MIDFYNVTEHLDPNSGMVTLMVTIYENENGNGVQKASKVSKEKKNGSLGS